MIFVSCPTCQRVIPASPEADGTLRCNKCRTAVDQRQASCSRCSQCSSLCYTPPGQRIPAILPCHLDGGAALPCTPPQEAPHIRCSCGADLQLGPHSRLLPCPVCGSILSKQDFNKQLYYLNNGKEPIQLTWNPEADDLYYIHPHSDAIPPLSLLIVDPYQSVVYISGGMSVTLENSTYALFGEEAQDTTGIARLLNASEGVEPLRLQVNTRVIFFDKRAHVRTDQISYLIDRLHLRLTLPFSYNLSITDPMQYLRNADALTGDHKLDDLQAQVRSAINEFISQALDGIPPESYESSTTLQSMRVMLRSRLNEQEICAAINAQLGPVTGAAISNLAFQIAQITLEPARPSSREAQLLEMKHQLDKSRTSPFSSTYIQLSEELWADYANPDAGLLMAAYYLSMRQQAKAFAVYSQLKSARKRLTPSQLQKLEQLAAHLEPTAVRT